MITKVKKLLKSVRFNGIISTFVLKISNKVELIEKMKLRLYILLIFALVGINGFAITLNEAKALVNAGDYTRAVVAFRSLISQPGMARNAEVNKFYGQCLCMTGQYAESIKYLEVGAKGGKTGALWYLGISKQHLYDFEGAIENLKQYRAKCSATSGWIERTDSIISECELGLRAVNHVQDVVVIDSLMVPAQNFFSYYKLGSESGHILAPADCGENIAAALDSAAAVFENPAKDYRLMTMCNPEDGTYSLYSSSFFEGKWEDPEKIESIGGEEYKVAYPFQRSDGETLYFACDTTPGLGGFDIYVTSFNTETDSYYTPSRLAMPFNSPYNDYMMAIDETHQVGWWATDRGANPGFVCIYKFIFEEEPDFLDGENASRARIDAIRDSWKEENYDELLASIENASQEPVHIETLYIPIREDIVYTSLDDFKNPKAREAYERYALAKINLSATIEDLEYLRSEYRAANATSRRQLRTQILNKEQTVLSLEEQLKTLAKEYRSLEK